MSEEQLSGRSDRREAGEKTPSASPVAERPSPHNLEIERAVLSAMLREPSYCGSVAVEKLGGDGAFYSQIHREIFRAFMRLYEVSDTSIDVLMLAEELKKAGKLEACGGLAGLAELERRSLYLAAEECRDALRQAAREREACEAACSALPDPAAVEPLRTELQESRNEL